MKNILKYTIGASAVAIYLSLLALIFLYCSLPFAFLEASILTFLASILTRIAID